MSHHQILFIAIPVLLTCINPAHGQSPYRVHVETTKITEPLDKEGFVDYVAYVNERAKRGVVSEKNAMAAASRLFHRDDYPEFYRELGSTMPSREDSLLGISDFIGELERKRLAKGEEKPAILAHSSRLRKQFETARLRPWSAAEFPMVLKLIARNEEQLNELAAAAALPSYYAPSLPHPSGRVALAILPLRLELVMSCRQLSARAMLRLKQEEFQGAFEDLLACNRWSKHLTNESMVIGHIAAWAISNTSHVGMDHLFRSPALELKQAEAFFAAHQQLGDYPSCSKCRREGDLFMQLDDAARVARRKLLCSSAGNGPLAKADESIAGRIAGRTESLARNWLIPVLADWDAVMTRVNSQFEHQARIAEARTYAETVALESAYGVAHQSDVFCYELRDAIDALLARRSPRRIATDWAATILTDDNFFDMHRNQRICQSQWRVERVFMAVTIHKLKHGELPKSLGDVNDLLKKPIRDFNSGLPYAYRAQKNSFRLYSVGFDRRDNSARPDSDDFVVLEHDFTGN